MSAPALVWAETSTEWRFSKHSTATCAAITKTKNVIELYMNLPSGRGRAQKDKREGAARSSRVVVRRR